MLVSEIITRVRAAAGDTDVLQFTDNDCIRWINDGMRECAIENELLQKTATSTVVNGTSDYVLPTDIAKLHSVKYDNVKLQFLSMAQFDELITGADSTNDKGTPQYALLWAGNIRLYPTPDNSTSSLRIDYQRQPVEVTATGNTPEIPVDYHRRLVDYCLAMVAEQDDDMNRYQIKMQEFKTGVQDLSENRKQETDMYPMVGISQRDMGEGMWDGFYYE